MADALQPLPDTGPAYVPSYKRITPQQRLLIRQLHREGKSQPEIAQILGCSQPTISKWLAEFIDTTSDANEFLRNKALAMAKDIEKNGKPDVKLKALQGLGVASENSGGPAVVIQIGGQNADIQVSFAPVSQASERRSAELPTIDVGSDK
jgi:uncharacterized protein YjcR